MMLGKLDNHAQKEDEGRNKEKKGGNRTPILHHKQKSTQNDLKA